MLQTLSSKPFTILYPVEVVLVPAAFRGKVTLHDDQCIGCSKYSLVCPVQCITMMENQRKVRF
jgi:formate hydrogenlyase subunit 6/NADH:ubiquinone oxidoreductase subunit I